MKASIKKHLPTGWSDEADAMTTEQLRAVIVESEQNLAEVQRSAEEDEQYQALKAAAKDAGASYSDARKCQRAKISYALERLSQKGAI